MRRPAIARGPPVVAIEPSAFHRFGDRFNALGQVAGCANDGLKAGSRFVVAVLLVIFGRMLWGAVVAAWRRPRSILKWRRPWLAARGSRKISVTANTVEVGGHTQIRAGRQDSHRRCASRDIVVRDRDPCHRGEARQRAEVAAVRHRIADGTAACRKPQFWWMPNSAVRITAGRPGPRFRPANNARPAWPTGVAQERSAGAPGPIRRRLLDRPRRPLR